MSYFILCRGILRIDHVMTLIRFELLVYCRGKEASEAIGRTFALSNDLKQIDLSRNNAIGNEGVTYLAEGAKESVGNNKVAFPSLERLILSECNIGPLGVQSLADIILGPENGRRSKPIDIAIRANPIGSEGCKTLSKLCSIPGRGSIISQLHMSDCSIGDEGIKLLAKGALAHPCIGLTVLDLSENSITAKGVKEFAESLRESWPDLTELKLAKNELKSDGVALIMASLATRSGRGESSDQEKKNSTLQSLDLSCTNCGIEGAKSALMSGSLQTLRLFNNRLGSDGFHAISPLLKGGHPSLENLDLGGNNAKEEAVVALLNAIADKEECGFASKLSVLEIGGNEFGDEAMEALEKLKGVWPKLDVAHDKPVQHAEE